MSLRNTRPWLMRWRFLLGYCVVAGALGVSLVFAAFLAGFAVVHTKRRLFAEALDAIGKVSFAFFVPLYFAIVGLKLDLVRGFSLGMVFVFIAGSCVVKILSVSLAGRLRRISRPGPDQSRDHHKRARRTRHRAGQRGLRCRHHQPEVLHHADTGGGADFADGRRLA